MFQAISLLVVAILFFVGCKEPTRSTTSSASASASDTPLDPEAAARKGFQLYDAKDETGAVKAWQPACEAGDDAGCTGMGIAHTFGVGGVAKDYAKGKALVEPPCTRGLQRACSVLGQIYYNAWGVEKDLEKARGLWRKACDADISRACYFLGIAMWASDGPPEWRDQTGGAKLIRRSCTLGYKSGCELQSKLDQSDRMKTLREKVKTKHLSDEPDALCTGKGLPPYQRSYEGGTFAEDAEVATADRCVGLFPPPNTLFCCPSAPGK